MSRGTPATDAYVDLKAQARRENRATQELLQLYLLEGFLARLAASELRDLFVPKGGVLLAAFDARRPTRDVDLAGIQIANDAAAVLVLVRTVLGTALDDDDGIEFDTRGAVAETIREDDEYAGVRVSANAALATARLSFHVDVNVGDPIWPAPEVVAVPRLRGGPAIQLTGYPLHMVHAEKIVTAIQRGIANTRWRDFGDIWTLSRHHELSAENLHRAITRSRRIAMSRWFRSPTSSTVTPTSPRAGGQLGDDAATPTTFRMSSPPLSLPSSTSQIPSSRAK